MIGSIQGTRGRVQALGRRTRRFVVTSVAVLLVATSFATAVAAFGGGTGAGRFVASFEASAVADPTIRACRALPAVQKVEGRYRGSMAVGGDEFELNFTLEARVDRTAGAGIAEGRWRLLDPRTAEIIGSGQLLATVTADPPGEADPPTEADPPSESDPPGELVLHGLLVGLVSPPDPDMPTDQKLVGNFTAVLDAQALNFTGSVGDPTAGELLPAVLIANERC
jgi:hypothetical protein